MKQTTFNNTNYTTNIQTDPNTVTMAAISANKKTIHSAVITRHLMKRNNNKILKALPPNICCTEETLHRHTRRNLAQLRTNNYPFLKSYTKSTLTNTHHHSASFAKQTYMPHNSKHIHTALSPRDLWTNSVAVAEVELLAKWSESIAAEQTTEQSDQLHATVGGGLVGRQREN